VRLAGRKPYTQAKALAESAPAPVGGLGAAQFGKPIAVSSDVKLWPFVVLATAPVVDHTKPENASVPSAAEGTGIGPDAAFGIEGSAPSGYSPGAGGRAVVDVQTTGRRAMGGKATREDLAGKNLNPPRVASEKSDFDAAMFARWMEIQMADGRVVAEARSALLLTLLDALGVDVPQGAWVMTLNNRRDAASLPAPGLIAALRVGARAGRIGESVLLSLAVLGPDAPDGLHPSVIGPVLRGLVAVGLAKEARALAIEVAFGAGL
jgi:hypothetical protein